MEESQEVEETEEKNPDIKISLLAGSVMMGTSFPSSCDIGVISTCNIKMSF